MFIFLLITSISLFRLTLSQACNGNLALCSRKYSNVTQVGTHDSPFVGQLPTQNQILSVSEQLVAGARFLQAQTHLKNGVLEMCHTSCDLEDAGSLNSYLTTIKLFLDFNPNEVITLLLTNGNRVPAAMFDSSMTNSGLARYAYTPPKQLAIDEWPTLQELITSGKRLVLFLDYGADTNSVPYMLDEFKYFFETAYDITDPNFSSCALDRPPKSDGSNLMMLVNHFLDRNILGGILIPDRESASRTNSPTGMGSIGAQSDLCTQTWKRKPNLILIDYLGMGKTPPIHGLSSLRLIKQLIETGDAMTAQKNINGL